MNDDAMDFFKEQGRKPSFSFGGKLRGARSRPGAPQANPSQGLLGSSAVDWMNRFNNVGQQTKNAARMELGLAPERPATGGARPSTARSAGLSDLEAAYAETQRDPLDRAIEAHDRATGRAVPVGGGGGSSGAISGVGGIVGQVLEAFGPGYWNKLVGRGAAPAASPWSTPPPMETATGTQGIARRVTGLPMGQFATASFVLGQNSPANLAKRKNPFSWDSAFARNG